MFLENKDFEAWMKRIMERFDRLEKKIEKPEQPKKTRLIINGEELLDNQDLCLQLNVCKRTLQYYRTRGWLPYRKIDQKTYYSESDVKTFLREYMRKLRNLKKKQVNKSN